MKKPNICIVGPGLGMGGIERASSNIANFLCTRGYSVTFAAIFRNDKFFRLEKNIQFYEPDGQGKTKTLKIIPTILWIRRTVLASDVDIVIVFNKLYAALTLIALKFTRVRVFTSERSSPFRKWPTTQKIIIDFGFFIHRPAGLIAQTGLAADVQRKNHPGIPTAVIPNMLRDVKLYQEVTRENWILAVGRFGDTAKGFDRLLEAFALLKNKNWKLVFAGGDSSATDLAVNDPELGRRVMFLGKVSDIDAVYARAGIFVIPSRHEGFPNALCEAMAAGLPSISFDFISGPSDIITNDFDGLLVKDGDIHGLAQAIDELIVDDMRRARLASNAMKIRERLGVATIGDKLIDFILKDYNV